MEKIEKMEIFQKNLEEAGFTNNFIIQSLHYFTELNEEMEVQELATVEEAIDYFAKVGSFTCSTLKSEDNLKDLRQDLYLLYPKDYSDILNFNLYFENIEEFEIRVLYTLYINFYPREEEEINK